MIQEISRTAVHDFLEWRGLPCVNPRSRGNKQPFENAEPRMFDVPTLSFKCEGTIKAF